MNLTKNDYIQLVQQTLKTSGAVLIETEQTSYIRCVLNGKVLRFYIRYRHFTSTESKLTHFEKDIL